MASWSFLSSHARVLLCIARDPGARLRDIAASVGITERSAHAIVSDLAGVGYVVRQKDGRRIRYQIQAHLPLSETGTGELAIGEVSPSSPARYPRHRTARPRDPDARGQGGNCGRGRSQEPGTSGNLSAAEASFSGREGRVTLRWPRSRGGATRGSRATQTRARAWRVRKLTPGRSQIWIDISRNLLLVFLRPA